MRIKNKKVVVLSILIVITISVLGILIYKNNESYVYIDSSELKDSPIALYVQASAGSTSYSVSNTIPKYDGNKYYKINSSKTKCQVNNTNEISYDAIRGKIKYKLTGSNECKVYLDVIAPSVDVTIPTLYSLLYMAKHYDINFYDNDPSFQNCGVTWNKKYNKANVNLLGRTNGVNCGVIDVNAIGTYDNLAQYITSLAGTTSGDGKVVAETYSTIDEINGVEQNVTGSAGIRYEGANPNNYVWFSNSYWRIIGVFTYGEINNPPLAGPGSTKFVKLIKDDSIGSYSYDSYQYSAEFYNQSIYEILSYYTSSYSTTECYLYNNAKTTCDFSENGLDYKLDYYFDWNILITPERNASAGSEAGEMFYWDDTKHISDTNSYTGYGLMTASDYLFASDLATCNESGKRPVGSNYNNATYGQGCAGKNWLNKYSEEWTMTTFSNAHALAITNGNVVSTTSYYSKNIRPVVFLRESVVKLSGDGSYENPYVLEMA